MSEVHKERLQHLLANSILEMWKKETGSSLSVLIEGTICITSCHGKVTVIQISNQFPGFVDRELMSPSEAKIFEQIRFSRRSISHDDEELINAENKQLKRIVKKDDNNNDTSDFMEEEEMLDVVDEPCNSPVKRGSDSGEEEREESDDEKMREMKTDSCEHSGSDSAIHDLSDDRAESIEDKKPLSGHNSDLLISSPLMYTAQVHNAIGAESVLKNHLLGKKMNHQLTDANPLSPESEPSNSPTHPHDMSHMEQHFNNNNNNRVKFPISPMWPIKKEFHDRIFESSFKHASPMGDMHLMANSLLTGFIPAAHSSNLNSYLRMHSLPPLMPSTVKELTNRSFSVPVFPPTDEKPFDLVGRNLSTSAAQNRGDSSSAPASASNSEQKIYKCLFCHKTFLFKSKYHEHLPVHTSARPFQCHLCSRTYKYKYDLRVHLRTHLGIPTKSTICPFCSNKFSTNKQLRQHIRDEHNEQQRISDEQCAQSLLMALPSA